MEWVLIIILLLALLLVSPISFLIDYNGEIRLFVKYLLFKLQIMPQKEKAKKAEKPTETKKAKKEHVKDEAEAKKAVNIKQMAGMAKDFLEALPKPFFRFLKGISISKLRLHMAVCGDDAAQAAINAGNMNMYVYNIYGLAENLFTVKKLPDIKILPDFFIEEDKIDLHMEIGVRPIAAISLAVGIAGSFLIKTIKRSNANPKAKKAKKNRKSTENKKDTGDEKDGN